MELAGVKVDPDQLRALSNDFSVRMAELEVKAHELAGRPFNLGSPKQIADILFGEMGLEGGKKTAGGAASTDASLLEDLALQGHELPRTLLDWRQLSKLKGTYTDNLIEAINPKTAGCTPRSAWPPPQRAAWPPPIPTCRTSRSAPRKAARSARPSSPSRAMS
jgi:DNA polymerase-1